MNYKFAHEKIYNMFTLKPISIYERSGVPVALLENSSFLKLQVHTRIHKSYLAM